MALSELIKYEGDNSTFIWKYPHEDFNNMTELVVHETQEAIFFLNGQIADTFGPGWYQLDSGNIPVLTKMMNLVTGVSVFHCEVYFINKTVQMTVRWGTDSKVRFIEPMLGVPVELGASGELSLAVADSGQLIQKLVGTMNGIAWDEGQGGFAASLKSFFKPLIATSVKSHLPAVIKQENIDIIEIDEHLDAISDALKSQLNEGFEEYGLSVTRFFVTNVVLPESDPNFKRLKELRTVRLQTAMAHADAEIKTARAESRAAYSCAEAEADAKIKTAQRDAALTDEITETEIAKKEAERKIIQSRATAEAAEIVGMAEAKIMRAQGYTKKDVLAADVQKAYAEGIGKASGGGNSAMGEMIGLGAGMAAMGAMAPRVNEILKGFDENDAQENLDAESPQANAQTVKCPECGTMLPTGAKFCLECGAKLETNLP